MRRYDRIQSSIIVAGSENLLRSICVVLLLVCAGQFAALGSQSRSYQAAAVPIPHPLTVLLRSTAVHRELRLSPDRAREVEDAVSQVDLPLWLLRDLPLDKRNETAASLIERLNNNLSAMLSVRQLERLNQIVLQARSIDAFLEPQVVTRLNISPGQYSSIKILLDDSYKRLASLQTDVTIPSESIRSVRIVQLQAESKQSLLSLLSPAQRQNLTTLLGPPFDLSRVRRIVCRAPEFKVATWLNSSPLTMSELKGKVTVVHFYAFGCGNCIRTLPYYNDWQKHFGTNSFRIVAIHRPETQQERVLEKVEGKANEAGMDYPIAIDNDSIAWEAWANHIWPSIYLVDKNGFVRYWWYGELNYQGAKTEPYLRARIQELIDEGYTAESANAAGS